VAELDQESPSQERVDLIVLGDENRQAVAGQPLVRHLRRIDRGAELKTLIARKSCGERGGAYRLDQITGETAVFEVGEFVA